MTVIFTGLTFKDVENREDTTGIEEVCYLCKRKEEEDSLTLQREEDGEFEMVFRPIELQTFAMTVPSDSIMGTDDVEEVEVMFPLCKECQILLGINSLADEEGEEI